MVKAYDNYLLLEEYTPVSVPPEDIPNDIGTLVYSRFGKQVRVDFPSPATQGNWRFTSQGWVGFLPITRDFGISLRPKVPVKNLFRMLEHAYSLDLLLPEGIFESESLEGFYELLALNLASRIMNRIRKGLYRSYPKKEGPLPYVRGRMDVRKLARKDWAVLVDCQYHEQTTDVDENRLLAWTLYVVNRSRVCKEKTSLMVGMAYRALRGFVSLKPYGSRDCIGKTYNRLNDDYKLMHGLCRFFLDNSGPGYEFGDNYMLPFLVNMERLFELFVAEWLKSHIPEDIKIKAKEVVPISPGTTLHFEIDIVIYNEEDKPIGVMDTKYKKPKMPSTDDISQAVAYAKSKGCSDAFLVYPIFLETPIDFYLGDVRVRSLTFSLDDDLEHSGEEFMKTLLYGIRIMQLP